MNFTIEVSEEYAEGGFIYHKIKIGEVEKFTRLSNPARNSLKPEQWAQQSTYELFKKIKEGMMDYAYREVISELPSDEATE